MAKAKKSIPEPVETGPRHNANGQEILSTERVAIPARILRLDSEAERMRSFIRHELSKIAQAEQKETFEEADDFDVGDDYEPSSPYELDEGQFYERGDPPTPVESKAAPTPAEPHVDPKNSGGGASTP